MQSTVLKVVGRRKWCGWSLRPIRHNLASWQVRQQVMHAFCRYKRTVDVQVFQPCHLTYEKQAMIVDICILKVQRLHLLVGQEVRQGGVGNLRSLKADGK